MDVGRPSRPATASDGVLSLVSCRVGAAVLGRVSGGRQSCPDRRSSDQRRMARSTSAKARLSTGTFLGLNHRISAVSVLVRASSGRSAWPTK